MSGMVNPQKKIGDRCPCCDADESSIEFEKEVLGNHRAEYARCAECRSLFVVNPHWLSEAYALSDRDASDGGRWGRADAVDKIVGELTQNRIIEAHGRWLDYGSGDGLLGALLSERGYDACSYDPYVELFSTPPDGRFTAASLVEVVEHLTSPRAVFKRLGELTDTLIVTIEPYRDQGSEWPYLACPWGQHVTFPSLAGLSAIAAAGGFDVHAVPSVDDFPIEVFVMKKKAGEEVAEHDRHIVLYNLFHAGDVVMSRTIIQEIVAHNPGVSFSLECQPKNAYLWQDLGLRMALPRPAEERGPAINLHFAAFSDSLKKGLTYRNNVETYNRQACALGLRAIEDDGEPRFIELPRPEIGHVPRPAVLLENGPVLSGQLVHELNPHLIELSKRFGHVTFYLTHAPGRIARANLVDVSRWDLPQLSVLSEACQILVCRLSAVMVASFTRANHGRRRIVYGQPLGCAIWDEVGVVYVQRFEDLCREIREGTRRGHD